MNKILIESQEGVLFSTPPMLGVISMLSSTASQSIQNVQTLQRFSSPLYVLKAHLTTTGLRTTILLSNRHFSIRRGSHTFTGGRNQPLNQKTHTTSNHLLFKHLHANRTELQHLQTRTFSNH